MIAGAVAVISPVFHGHHRDHKAFSIVPPEGWPRWYTEKRGDFYDTRWRAQGVGDVYLVVDYTPGFAGSAEAGALGETPGHRGRSRVLAEQLWAVPTVGA
jgi:hypothetical protein